MAASMAAAFIAPARDALAAPAALACFAVLLAGCVFGGLASDSIAFFRTHATAWSMTLLASIAMHLYVAEYRRGAPGAWWLAFWTAGWLMNLAHYYLGLFDLHAGEPATVFARQGFLLAFSIFFFTGLWGLDVLAALMRRRWPEGRIARLAPAHGWLDNLAFVVGFLTFFISTVIFRNDMISLVVGLIMTGAVLWGLLRRLSPSGAPA